MPRNPPDIDFVLRRPFIQFSGDEIQLRLYVVEEAKLFIVCYAFNDLAK